jgi:hypothetical protein
LGVILIIILRQGTTIFPIQKALRVKVNCF